MKTEEAILAVRSNPRWTQEGRFTVYDQPRWWGTLKHEGCTYGESASRQLKVKHLEELKPGWFLLVFLAPGTTGWAGRGVQAYYPATYHAHVLQLAEEYEGFRSFKSFSTVGRLEAGRHWKRLLPVYIDAARKKAVELLTKHTQGGSQ